MKLFGRSDGRLNRGLFGQLRLTHVQRGLVFGTVALLTFIPILCLNATPVPSETDWTDGTAILYFAASNSRVIFPNQCLDVTWNVEGIKTISINEQGIVGTGTEKICDTTRPLSMQVVLQDGSSKELRIGVQKLFLNPIIALLLITGLVSLSLSAHNLINTSAGLAVLAVTLTGPSLLYFIESEGAKFVANDYMGHLRIIQGIMDGTGNVPPHFLYHISAIGLVNLFPQLNFKDATLVLLVAANIFSCIAIYTVFRLLIGKRPDTNWKWTLIYLAIPLILFIGPINFIMPFNTTSAYVYPNPPHSPTHLLLKPFAVGLFACLIALYGSTPKRWLLVMGMAVLTVLATIAKPSYTLPLVPTLGLVLLRSFVRPLPVKRWELIGGILLPAVIALGWQYLFTYGPQQSNLYGEAASIKFSPLELYLVYWEVPAANLIPELIISLIFPIVVYVMYRRAWQDFVLNLAWLIFIAGQAMAFLLIESPHFGHGNMVWSGRITALVLFVVSIAFFLRQNRDLLDKDKGFPRDGRFYLGMLLLAIQIIPTLNLLL